MADFVNPYTFVPIAVHPDRSAPAGHAAMGAGHVSGALRITLTARTPLLLGGYRHRGADGADVADVPRRADGTPMIPGSSLLGAVRSVHEALTGGCLRVLDADWVPVHRHPATTAVTRRMRLAVVRQVDHEGQPTSVTLCDDEVWIDKDLLPAGPGGRVPRTGDRLDIPAALAVQSGDRRVLRARDVAPDRLAWRASMGFGGEDSWALLVTDTRTRLGKPTAYFVAGLVGSSGTTCAVGEGVWPEFLKTVEGADDMRPERLPGRADPVWPPDAPEHVPVKWPPPQGNRTVGTEIGERLRARPYMHVGQPVWVRVEGGSVTEIRLSQLWRYRGSGAVGDRVGAATPCADPASLCWSCRVFGSADTAGRDADDASVQRSYRGHVRVEDLLGADFQPLQWPLAPLSSPRPSAGQFYLDHTGLSAAQRTAAKDTEPAATWGSCADDPDDRLIRGRKFYWRTEAPASGRRPRGRRRAHHENESIVRDVALVPEGTVFTGRVCFDNLSVADLGSLLCALDPRLVWPTEDGLSDVVVGVGGGKPFGFGSATIDVAIESVATAAVRYLGGSDDELPDAAAAVQAFHGEAPHPAKAGWPALRNALALGFVPDDLVWYPPAPGTSAGDKGGDAFDRSFEFFPRTAGVRMRDEVRELVELPRADDPAERQVLDSNGRVRAIQGGQT
jgi:hypothetical protein